MFALPILRFAAERFQKARAAKNVNEVYYERSQDLPQRPSSSPPQSKHFQPLAVIPLVITSIVLILSLLCIFAGHTTSMMQDYAVFALNTSRIGENVVHKLEDNIRSFDLSDFGLKKRDELVVLTATPAMAPTTLITVAPIFQRGNIESIFSKATHNVASDVKSLKSQGKSEFSEATSAIHSKIKSAESAVATQAASIIKDVEDGLIKLTNNAYYGFIDDLNIQDFYNVHVMASCKGTYVFQNGTNVTVGGSAMPASWGPNSVHQHVDTCTQHSAIDPMSLIRIIYWASIVFTIASFLSGFGVLARGCSRKLLLLNLLITLHAFIAIALASLVVHGLALAATKVINFLGSDLGVAANLGHKFLAMTWAATGLLALNSIAWVVIYYAHKHQMTAAAPAPMASSPSRREQYPMRDISRPGPVHERAATGRYF